jgi:hypothetical protein
MHENAIEARAPDACDEHNNSEHEQSAQKAKALSAFAAMNVRGMFCAGAFKLGAEARCTRRRGAMQPCFAGCNHGLRGFVLTRLHHRREIY